jgi:hypothetical protein
MYGIPFIETSAKDTININELFEATMRKYMNKSSGNRKKLVVCWRRRGLLCLRKRRSRRKASVAYINNLLFAIL